LTATVALTPSIAAVITAFPNEFAETIPSVDTLATELAFDDQETVFPVITTP